MERMYISNAKFKRRKHGPELVELTLRTKQVDDKALAGLAVRPIKVTLDGKRIGYIPMYKFMIKAVHPNTPGTNYNIILATAKPEGISDLPFYKEMKITSLLGKAFGMENAVSKNEASNKITISENKTARRRKKKK